MEDAGGASFFSDEKEAPKKKSVEPDENLNLTGVKLYVLDMVLVKENQLNAQLSTLNSQL